MSTSSYRTSALVRILLVMVATVFLLPACAPAEKKTTERRYMFWPPSPDVPHIQFLMSISTTADVTAGQDKMDVLLYGKQKANDLPFARPYGIRMMNGCIYVCDATSNNVSILDLRKKEVRILGRTGQVMLAKPIDLAIAPDGVKYVADTGHGAIVVFDNEDKYAGKISLQGLRPVAVAVQGNELYVSDHTASKIRVFDRFNGRELRSFGGPGSEKGKFGGAMGLAIDKEGNIYVNDLVGCRVQKFSPKGEVLFSLGGIGDRPGNFVRPKHMTVDSSGILYVVDNAFQNVQMFNDKGQLLMFFGAQGSHPGAMSMPTGICTSDSDLDLFQPFVHPAFNMERLVFVTNNLGDSKINIYALGTLKPGKTLADIRNRIDKVFGFEEVAQETPLNLPDADLQAATQAATQPATAPAATQPASQPRPKPSPEQRPF